jgi:hypothetical protein
MREFRVVLGPRRPEAGVSERASPFLKAYRIGNCRQWEQFIALNREALVGQQTLARGLPRQGN